MKTIKLPYTTEDYNLINRLIRQQSIVLRWSYNRFLDGKNEKEIRELSKHLKSISDLDSWFVQSSIKEASYLYKSNKDKKVIFNKLNFIRRQKGLISKEEFKKSKNLYINSIGESLKKGNRKLTLDLNNNQIIFKPKVGIKLFLKLPKLRKNIKNELSKLDILSKECKLPISFKLDNNFVYITFEECKVNEITRFKTNKNTCLGIDLNPNYIGLSVLKFNKESNFDIISTECFDISKLTDRKGNHDKLKFELIEITNKIINICKHNKVQFVFVEELNFGNSKNLGFGKRLNNLCLNKFLRNLFQQQLEKRCKLYGLNIFKVGAQYSSYIGNIQYDYFDPINASIEIARRGYEVIISKNRKFYPNFWIKQKLIDQWKESVSFCKDWKELFKEIKNSKLKYRVSLDQCIGFNVFENFSHKSKVTKIVFD